jgi:hypothetical protein
MDICMGLVLFLLCIVTIIKHVHELSYVFPALNPHPQGDINTNKYKINTSNLHIRC